MPAKSPSEIDFLANRLAKGSFPGNAMHIFSKDDWERFKPELLALALEIVDGAELDPNYNVYYLEGAAMIKTQLRAAFRKAFQ